MRNERVRRVVLVGCCLQFASDGTVAQESKALAMSVSTLADDLHV